MATRELIGRRIANKYEIKELIGRGGMGDVFRGWQDSPARDVAIKVLRMDHLSQQSKVQRFAQEAKTNSRLIHPNVATVYDYGFLPEGQPYIVYEYLPGRTLADVLQEKQRLTADDTTQIAIQLCSALQAAHELGIVHRDLKPSNIIVACESPELMVKIIDFGTAKILRTYRDGTDFRSLTATGNLIGTPYYISPEEILGNEIDHRADLYGLGCVLYELVTGKVPFSGRSDYDIFSAHINQAPPPLENVPSNLEHVILQCLAKKPVDRYNTAAEVVTALMSRDSQVRGPARSKVLTASTQIPVLPRPVLHKHNKHKLIACATIGSTVVAVAVVAVLQFSQRESPPPQPPQSTGSKSAPHTVLVDDPKSLPPDLDHVRKLATIREQEEALEQYLVQHPGFNPVVEHRLIQLYANNTPSRAALHANNFLQNDPTNEHLMSDLLGSTRENYFPLSCIYLRQYITGYPNLPHLKSVCEAKLDALYKQNGHPGGAPPEAKLPALAPQELALPTALAKASKTSSSAKSAERPPRASDDRKHVFPDVGSEEDWQKADKLYKEANELYSNGMVAPALAKLLEGLKIYPYDAQHFNLLGLLLIENKDMPGAERAFRESARLSPRMWAAWDNLGRTLWTQKRYSEASFAWRKSMACKPPQDMHWATISNVAVADQLVKQSGDGSDGP